MPQQMIHQDNGQHGLGDRRRSHANTGVMAALGHDFRGIAGAIHALTWFGNTGCRL